MNTRAEHDAEPFVAFTPRLGRFIVAELQSATLSITAIAVVLYLLRGVSWESFLFAVGFAVLGILSSAVFMRRSRRIVIGDTWITGPTGGKSETTSIEFGTVDRERTRLARGRLHIASIGGREITAKIAWYSPEDVEEMTRLIRDRCGAEVLPVEAL